MTTLWKIEPEWKGLTVAVIGGAPGITAEGIEALRGLVDKVVVVNSVQELAPWADMLVSLDGPWPEAYAAFAGIRVAGVEQDDLDARYAGPWWEKVEMGPGHIIEFRNSGMAAIRIAAAMGASRIVLAGFQPELGRNWQASEAQADKYTGVRQALDGISAQLEASGVPVEHHPPPAAAPPDSPKPKRAQRG